MRLAKRRSPADRFVSMNTKRIVIENLIVHLNQMCQFPYLLHKSLSLSCLGVELIGRYGTKAEEFVVNWMAFSLAKPSQVPDQSSLKQFENDVLSKEKTKAETKMLPGLDDSLVIHNKTTIDQM